MLGLGGINCRPQKYPDEVGGNTPSNVPAMNPVPGKMGGNGGKWGEIGGKWGGNGVLWGQVGANNKNCGARVHGFGFPVLPHFPPFPPIFPRELSPMHPPPPPNPMAQRNCDDKYARTTRENNTKNTGWPT